MSVPEATGDDRPFGWGVCVVCGRDCKEQDYNATTRQSLCQTCWLKKERERIHRNLGIVKAIA